MKYLALALLVGCGTTLNAEPARAAPTPTIKTTSGFLLAISKRDHTLAIVDPTKLEVLARAPVGEDPHEVIADEAGHFAYVSNYGGGSLNTLAVIDLAKRQALPSIDLGAMRGPHGLVATANEIWFTAEGSKAIGRFDPATQKIDWIMGTGQDRTHMLYVTPDRIVTANVASGTMTVIDRVTQQQQQPPPGPPPPGAPHGPPPGPRGPQWKATVIPVGSGPEGFDVTPDGKEVWVANAHDGTISIIDPAAKQVTQTLAANVNSANRLRITPDGKRALVSMLGAGDVVVFDIATRKEVTRIPIGHGAAGIVMQPDGKRAFVACTPDNYVQVIDLATLAVTAKIDVGGEPDGLAWSR